MMQHERSHSASALLFKAFGASRVDVQDVIRRNVLMSQSLWTVHA